MTVDQLTELHIKHNYYVKIKPLDTCIGFVAHFPVNILTKAPKLDRTYIVFNEGKSIEIFDCINSGKTNCATFDVEDFSMRVLILQDVLLKTIARKMSQSLIIVESQSHANIFDILKIDLCDKAEQLEKDLCIKFRELVLGRIDRNPSDDLNNSYEMLVNFFEKGGF